MSYTRLRYHIVTATKYREPLLTPDVESVAYKVLRMEAETLGAKISHIGGIEDHIHIIAAIPPTLAVSTFVGRIKTEATKALKRNFAHLDAFAWQPGFGAFTLNPNDMDGIIHYVLNQKNHHRKDDLWAQFERL